MKYTVDEKAMIAGALGSAGTSGVGIYVLYTALAASTIAGYTGSMIVGAMLFNAGISGLCAIGAMWANYRAVL